MPACPIPRLLLAAFAALLVLGAGEGTSRPAAAFDVSDYDRYLRGGAVTSRRMETRPAAEPGDARQSDDAFLDELVALEEKQAVAASETNRKAKAVRRSESAAPFRVGTDFFRSNRRPGYMLFTGEDADYESRGGRVRVFGTVVPGFTVSAGHATESFGDGTTDDVELETTDLTFAGKLSAAGRFSVTLRRRAGSVPSALGELEASALGKASGLNLGVEAARRHHASDVASCAAPVPYHRLGASVGGKLGGGFYAELRPSCADYPDDGNRRTEAAGGLYYYPAGAGDLTLDLHGRLFAHALDGAERGLVYFSPTAGSTAGIGLDWTCRAFTVATAGLSLSLDRERYTLGGTSTGYNTASGEGRFDLPISGGVSFRCRYGFDLTASDDYPVTQNARASLEYKF